MNIIYYSSRKFTRVYLSLASLTVCDWQVCRPTITIDPVLQAFKTHPGGPHSLSKSTSRSEEVETPHLRRLRIAISAISFTIALALCAMVDFTDRGPHFEAPKYASKLDPNTSSTPTHDLRRLRILTRCVGYIRANYVDPSRAKAKEMLVSALSDVERKVLEFMVDSFRTRNDLRAVSVRIGEEEREFSLANVDNLYTMSWKLLDIFEFISPRLSSTVSGQDIEYAAINGLLRVLDPHSILLTPSVYREMKLGTTGKFGGLGIVITQRDGSS